MSSLSKWLLRLRRYILWHITCIKYIFHVKCQLFLTARSDQDPDPHWFCSLDADPHWGKKLYPDPHLKPMRIRNTEIFLVIFSKLDNSWPVTYSWCWVGSCQYWAGVTRSRNRSSQKSAHTNITTNRNIQDFSSSLYVILPWAGVV